MLLSSTQACLFDAPKFRPACIQLILGIRFVFRAACNFFGAGGCHFRTAVSDNIEGGYSVGGGGLISGPRSRDNGGYSKNEGTHFGFSVEYVSSSQFMAQARSIIRSWEVQVSIA